MLPLEMRRPNGMESMHWPDGKAWSVEGTKISYCQGHDTGDILPFTFLFEGHDGPYSNKELVDLMDPTGADSPYIYDNFEWPHCLDEGYSVDLLTQSDMPDSNVRAARIPIRQYCAKMAGKNTRQKHHEANPFHK